MDPHTHMHKKMKPGQLQFMLGFVSNQFLSLFNTQKLKKSKKWGESNVKNLI